MASLQERNGSYRILFCHHGKLHTFTIGKVEKDEAENKARQVDYLLMRLKQRLIVLPEGTDIVTFVEHDGKPPDTGPTLADAPRQAVTLGHLKDRYLSTHANGTIEANSLDTCKLHLSHFCRVLGEGFPLGELSLAKTAGVRQPPGQGQDQPGDHPQGNRHAAGRMELGRADGTDQRQVPEPGPALPQGRRETAVHDDGRDRAADRRRRRPGHAVGGALPASPRTDRIACPRRRRRPRTRGFTRCSASPPTPGPGGRRFCGHWSPTWTSPAIPCWCERRSEAGASGPPAACR